MGSTVLRKVKFLFLFIGVYVAFSVFETCYVRNEGCTLWFGYHQTRGVLLEDSEATVIAREDEIKAKETSAALELKRPSCQPRKNVVFLKTHKTGSSTITNILNRIGHRDNLTFVLPRMGVNRLDWPWYFQNDSYLPLNGSIPNILCNHARYNRPAMVDLMPETTFYVTILREPRAHFESTFHFMMFDKMLGMRPARDPIEEFFKDPQTILMNYVLTQDLKVNSERLKLIRNSMFYDLGLATNDFENETKIDIAIKSLDSEFNLVMITEYFDESLVLLKRMMCWSLADIAYFPMNQRQTQPRRNLTAATEEKIYEWNFADLKLYEHFKQKLEIILASMGKDFWLEVDNFRKLNKALSYLCLEKNAGSQSVELAADIRKLKLRRALPHPVARLCQNMIRDEVAYLKQLRENQIARTRSDPITKPLTYLQSLRKTVIEPAMSYFYL